MRDEQIRDEPEVVRGAEAIGHVINETDIRRVYYWLERGYVPGAFKMGALWCLSVRRYRLAVHGDAA